MRVVGRTLSLMVAALAAMAVPAVAAASPAAAAAPQNLTCSGGDFDTFTPQLIPSGSYGSVTVTGFCEVASGATVTIHRGLTVAPGGFLVASGALDNGGQAPDCNRTITVDGGVWVQAGASLILGDGPGSGCSTNTSTHVNGGVHGDHDLNLIVHGATINGGVVSMNGGDGQPCNFQGFPTYSTVEDSNVNGGVAIANYAACWLGFARNHVNGGVSLQNNTLDDPDAMEILSNAINGGLSCNGNTAGGVPRATNYADDQNGNPTIYEPNSVHGAETGQCVGL